MIVGIEIDNKYYDLTKKPQRGSLLTESGSKTVEVAIKNFKSFEAKVVILNAPNRI